MQNKLKLAVNKHVRQVGYLLPAVIFLGLGISTASVVALQTVARNSNSLTSQHYGAVAKEAAQAGLAAAISCINSNNGTRLWGTGGLPIQENLTPRGCTLVPLITADDFINDNDAYTSTYSVSPVTDLNNGPANRTTSIITAKGIVKVKGPNGSITQTIEHTARAQIQTNSNSTGTPGAKNVTQVSTGTDTACAITEDASINDYWVYCWGNNANMQLGNGRHLANNRSAEPVPVYKSPTIQNEILGNCVQVFFNPCQYRDNPPTTPQQPISAMANQRAVKVSVGNTHTCAIGQVGDDATTRKAYCWGRNGDGQLGNFSSTDSIIPQAVDMSPGRPAVMRTPSPCGGWFQPSCTPVVDIPEKPTSSLMNKTVVDISAGNGFTCALTSDGLVSCWGQNGDGQLGNGTRDNISVPTAVTKSGSALSSASVKKLAIVKGNATTMCAITTTDDGVCWGKSDVGQTGTGSSIDPTNRSGSHTQRHTNPNQCNSLRATALNTAKAEAGGMPHADSDDLVPGAVAGGHKFDTIIINSASASGDGYESISAGTGTNTTRVEGSSSGYVTAKTLGGRTYQWGGTRSFSASVSCYRNSDTYGGDHSQASASVSRSYTGSPSPRLMYNATSGTLEGANLSLISGNSFNGLFCATSDNQLYCDNNGTDATAGQIGDGRVIRCGYVFIVIWQCNPTPTSGATRVSTTQIQGGDTSANHTSDLTVGMLPTISSLDTGNSGYTCAVANLSVLCWGANGSGQLGNGNTNNRYAPTYVFTGSTNGLGKNISGGNSIPISGTATVGSNNGSIANPTAAKSF